MPKSFIRIIALLLVTSLVANPVSASLADALLSPFSVDSDCGSIISQQALAAASDLPENPQITLFESCKFFEKSAGGPPAPVVQPGSAHESSGTWRYPVVQLHSSRNFTPTSCIACFIRQGSSLRNIWMQYGHPCAQQSKGQD